jgi:hypothetical protein
LFVCDFDIRGRNGRPRGAAPYTVCPGRGTLRPCRLQGYRLVRDDVERAQDLTTSFDSFLTASRHIFFLIPIIQ